MSDSHPPSTQTNPTLLAQKYAFATASLMVGISCFVNLLGFEKALLAILFGAMALRTPRAQLRRGWAITGIALGATSIALGLGVLLFYRQELARLIEYLAKFS